MKSIRYIVTRPCLQEGSLRLLKYLESTFPTAGPAVLVDEKGDEHAVQVDLERMRVWGLGGLYHAQHLGVNDVLMLTALAPGRYQVEAVVKPHAPAPPPRRETPRPPETRRVVVSSTPHVREIRMQTVPVTGPVTGPVIGPVTGPVTGPAQESGAARPDSQRDGARKDGGHKDSGHTAQAAAPEARVAQVRVTESRTPEVRTPEDQVVLESRVPQSRSTGNHVTDARTSERRALEAPHVSPGASGWSAPLRPLDVNFDLPAPVPAAGPAAVLTVPAAPGTRTDAAALDVGALDAGAQLAELAALTGYRLEHLGGGVLRLNAELGTHGYSVLVATSENAVQTPAWKENADYCVLLTSEDTRPPNTPCLTREALAALIEHAQLAPLSPVDLRGYWKAGSIDLESAASVAELVSSHLAQRGAFSFVLLTLSQQPAHSVVSVPRLAERLGSGVNYAELGGILDTLTRAPFLALTPLPGGQYLLRVGVPELLADLSEYADGVRRRVRAPSREVARA
ncbi:hypothetical protein [Deinococcus sp.]|uniref:hypothetical protein n=1 Tax=Deinococcus sp. TaxID=47478 RepID=UPI0025BAD09E|nr:hypothetical protein [Deinococcus sp.]